MAGSAFGWLAIHIFGSYGFTLFLAIPFFIGFLSTWIYTYNGPQSNSHCFGVACLSVLIAGATVLLIALDGLICLLMAIPIAFPLAILGAFVACAVNGILYAESQSGVVIGMFFALPFLAATESAVHAPSPEFKPTLRSKLPRHRKSSGNTSSHSQISTNRSIQFSASEFPIHSKRKSAALALPRVANAFFPRELFASPSSPGKKATTSRLEFLMSRL